MKKTKPRQKRIGKLQESHSTQKRSSLPLKIQFLNSHHFQTATPIETPTTASLKIEKWNQHEKKDWDFANELKFLTENFIGKGLLLTVNDPKCTPLFAQYPNKKTIIRIVGKFTRDTPIRNLWIGGVFPIQIPHLPPPILLRVGEIVARWKSPHFVLKPDSRRLPHVVTPLFPLIDYLNVKDLEGNTLEVLDSIDLKIPIKEDWMRACNYSQGFHFNPQKQYNYRKSLNKEQISNWPNTIIKKNQYVQMEFIDSSMDMTSFKVSFWGLSKQWTIEYKKFLHSIPFCAFDISDIAFLQPSRKWMCKEHKNQAWNPSSLQCCFPPLLKKPGNFLWHLNIA